MNELMHMSTLDTRLDIHVIPKKDVAAIIILGKDKDNNKYILFDCNDGNRHPFRFVGGKIKLSDLSPLEGLIREVNEEIGKGTIPCVCNGVKNIPLSIINTEKISGSSNELTKYQIHIFVPESYESEKYFTYSGDCGHRLIWMSNRIFKQLFIKVPDLFFVPSITENVLNYISESDTLYQMNQREYDEAIR